METLAESELLQLGATAARSGTSLKCGEHPAKGFQTVLSKGKKKKIKGEEQFENVNKIIIHLSIFRLPGFRKHPVQREHEM